MKLSNGNYEFNVLVNGKTAKEYVSKNDYETYIEGRKNSEYSLYFKNNTYNRVEVIFSVDGLSVTDGKVASDKSRGYIVNAYSNIDVPGWKIDNKKVAAFEFRPQGDKDNRTYVESLIDEGFDIDAGNQGVIGCMVFKELKSVVNYRYNFYPYYQYNYNPEPFYIGGGSLYSSPVASWGATSSSGGDAQGLGVNMFSAQSTCRSYNSSDIPSFQTMNMTETSVGTGFGDDKKFETVSVSFIREFSPLVIGNIFYDSLLQLKKKGVIIEGSKPRAFPNYPENGCYIPKNRCN